MTIRFRKQMFLATGIVAALQVSAAWAAERATIVMRDLDVRSVELLTMNEEYVHVQLGPGQTRPMPVSQFLAILFDGRSIEPTDDGVLVLADGQRFPGRSGASVDMPEDIVAWHHPRLGEIEFPLEEVSALAFHDASALPTTGQADVVVLTNGDRLNGFIVSLSDPVVIEADVNGETQLLEIPRDRVAAAAMVAPVRQPEGRRIWIDDGTVMNAQSVRIPAEGPIQLTGRWRASGTQRIDLPRERIAAILLDPARLMPFAALAPTRLDGPETRFHLPPPRVLNDHALLGLARLEFRGPLRAYYAIPRNASAFAATVSLPRESRTWGEFDLIIRLDGSVVFQHHFREDDPEVDIKIDVRGSELMIELVEGRYGPIQNHLIFRRAMFLLD